MLPPFQVLAGHVAHVLAHVPPELDYHALVSDTGMSLQALNEAQADPPPLNAEAAQTLGISQQRDAKAKGRRSGTSTFKYVSTHAIHSHENKLKTRGNTTAHLNFWIYTTMLFYMWSCLAYM